MFANGEANDGPMVQRALALAHEPLIIVADGGARVAAHYGFSVQTVIGDMDSLATQELVALSDAGAQVLRYPAEKDETDLELALKLAAARGATWIRIIGGVGNRLDQTLSNIYLMALPELTRCDARLVAGNQEMWLLPPGEHLIDGAVGDTISLLPLNGEVQGITTEALHYPLRGETLAFGPARGISNVLTAAQARVTVRRGILLCVHTLGRA
ncbi:MAG: thiamine diphosphokinase [Chloroflexi bacterium]|nr:thiamine diphosphokinase [Chloroflexota bacterium]